jgi:hypothetical protein
MAFTPAERVKIRLYMGYSAFFTNSNTSLETSMDQVADTATEDQIRAKLAILQSIDDKILETACSAIAKEIEGVKINTITSVSVLERLGRQNIHAIATMLGTMCVLSDYYSNAKTTGTINTKSSSEFGYYGNN